MKFINYLTSIADISIFPLISLSIFFVFFTGLIIYVVKQKNNTILEMKNIPLDNSQPVNDEQA